MSKKKILQSDDFELETKKKSLQVLQYHDHIKRLSQLISDNKLPRFIIFHGKPQTDIDILMLEIARMICCDYNCFMKKNAQKKISSKKKHISDFDPKCSMCMQVIANRHPDIWLADNNSNNLNVECASKLQDHVNYAPMRSSYRVAIVKDVDRFNISSINKLLLLLENPPKHALILCSSARLYSLLPTLLSRALIWPLFNAIDKNYFYRLYLAKLSDEYGDVDNAQSQCNEQLAQSQDSIFSQYNIKNLDFLYTRCFGCVDTALKIYNNYQLLDDLYVILFQSDFYMGFRSSKEFVKTFKISSRSLLFFIELCINHFYYDVNNFDKNSENVLNWQKFNAKINKIAAARKLLTDWHIALKANDINLQNGLILQSMVSVLTN